MEAQARQLRERMTGQVASLIRSGLNAELVAGAVAQLEDELTVLDKRADSIRWALAESASARDRVSSLDRLATTAAGRLGSMTLDERRDVLALLEVRVQITEEGFHVTGTVCELELPVEPGPAETKVLHSHGPPVWPG